MVRGLIQPPRLTAGRRHDPQMRNLGVCLKVHIDGVEHNPLSIWRWHRRTDPFEFHHVLEREGMLLRWRLREHRGGEQKECCEKTFHKRPSFRLTPTGASSLLGSARLWRVGDSDSFRESRTFADLRSLPFEFRVKQSSSPQNAATSTLQACAPRSELLDRESGPLARAESVRLGALW